MWSNERAVVNLPEKPTTKNVYSEKAVGGSMALTLFCHFRALVNTVNSKIISESEETSANCVLRK